MLSSPAFTHRAILSTNHWKGKRWRSFCQQLSGVRPTEQQLHSCELQLESDLLLNGSEFKNKIMIFLYNSQMSKNTPPFFLTKVGCIMYSLSCWITKCPKILWLKTINYYVSWFLWAGIQTEHSKDGLSLLYNVWDLSWKNLKLGTGIIWRLVSHGWQLIAGYWWEHPHVASPCGPGFLTVWWLSSKHKCSKSKEARWTAYCFYILI